LRSVQRLHNENEREKSIAAAAGQKKKEGKEVLSLESTPALVVTREDIVEIRYQATTNKYDFATSWNIYCSKKEDNKINGIL
jgi:hypothetical protein